MIRLGTQPPETERLILRRFAVTDAEAMYCNWASDPAVTKFLLGRAMPQWRYRRNIWQAGWSNTLLPVGYCTKGRKYACWAYSRSSPGPGSENRRNRLLHRQTSELENT